MTTPIRPCLIYCPYDSDWVYIGMEGGNVHVANVRNLELSGYTIYWEKTVDSG